MESIKSKDIIIILIGIVLSLIIAIQFRIESFLSNNEDIITLIIVVSISIVLVIYMKINEINKELDNQKIEQKKLRERLKIYEQLINMKADIKELQMGYKKWQGELIQLILS